MKTNCFFSILLGLLLLCTAGSGQITPPYTISFEDAESFTEADLQGQAGWQVVAGSASVINSEAFHGSKSVVLSAGFSAASISQSFTSFTGGEIVFVDFYARLVAGESISTASMFNAESSFAGLVKVGSEGEVYVSDGDGAGEGTWEATGFLVPLTTGDVSTDWVRFTMRLNFTDKKWDLFLDGDLVSYDLGFRDNTKTYLSSFNLTGHTATDGFLDYLYVWTDNPLYTDLDQDGMADSWETAHGLNPALIDRDSDLDGDGLSNIEEYRRGTHPDESDSDGDGLTDYVEVYLGTNPLTTDNYAPEFPVSGVLLHLRADAGIVIDGSGYLSQWQDRSGNGYHATQATAANQPQVIAGGLNGWPVVRFDGVDDYLSLPDVMAGATEGEIFIVARLKNFDNYFNGLAQFGPDNGVVYSPGDGGLMWEDFGTSPGAIFPGPGESVLTTPHVYNASITGEGESTVRFNGNEIYSRGTETVGFSTNPLLGNDVYNEFFNGDIAEVIVFDRALAEITDQIKVETGVDMLDYALGKKFIEQKAQIQQVYRFYEGLHHRNPEVQRWGGLAKRAGCAVYGGFSDMQRFYDQPISIVADKLVIEFLQDVLVEGGHSIFHDLAWQSRAYERGGYYALEFVRERELDTGVGVIKIIELEPWLKIARGDLGGDTSKILDGVFDLTNREQRFIVQPAWDRINAAPTLFILESLLSYLAKNPLPTEADFFTVYPLANVAIFDHRWPWVTNHMLPQWGAMDEPARNTLVDDPLVNAADHYAILPVIP